MRTKYFVCCGSLVALLSWPGIVWAQGPTIDHSAVGCIVAEQYPKLNACFSPASNLARARLFFRAGGGQHWYFVEFKPDTPCFQAVLPKPKKTIKTLEYYIEAVDKAFAESRGQEYIADVVPNRGACKKDVPAAAYLSKASVTVGGAAGAPAIPAGFAGLAGAGSAAGTIVGASVFGAGVAGFTGYQLSQNNGNNNNNPGPSNSPSGSGPTPSAGPSTPTPVPPTPGQPAPNGAPNAVFEISPDPPAGAAPLKVRFSMCGSSDPDGDPLTYRFDFGEGRPEEGGCRTEHVYRQPGIRSLGALAYTATMTVTDGVAGHERSRSYHISVDCPVPTLRIESPGEGDYLRQCNVKVEASAFDPTGIDFVQFAAQYSETLEDFGYDSSSPYSATWKTPSSMFMNNVTFIVTAQNKCGNSIGGDVTAFVNCYLYLSNAQLRRLSWVSDLDLAGGRGQVVLNNGAVSFPGAGRAFGLGEGLKGENRIEAQVVEGKGTSGTWRFDFNASAGFDAGSIRVITGEVVSVSSAMVVFRLNGRPGERIAFTFRTKE